MSKEAWWASSHGSLLMADVGPQEGHPGRQGQAAGRQLCIPLSSQARGGTEPRQLWLDGQRTYCEERPVQQPPRCPKGFPEMQGQGHQSGTSVSRRWKLTDLP